MKKPSIATTIDSDTLPPPTPHSRTPRKSRPLLVPHQYIELHCTSNWLYRCLGVAYLLECANNP